MVTNCDSAKVRIRPGIVARVECPIDPDVTSLILESFFKLYEGLKDANENTTGYSPLVAEAMKELREMIDGEEIHKAAHRRLRRSLRHVLPAIDVTGLGIRKS